LDVDGHYLVLLAVQLSKTDIRYGFHYYQNLNDNDLVEIGITDLADIIPWTSDQDLSEGYSLYGFQSGWDTSITLYGRGIGGDFSGNFPRFTALNLTSMTFDSNFSSKGKGIHNVTRRFDPLNNSLDIQSHQIELKSLSLTPLDLSWTSSGSAQAEIVTGMVFGAGLKHTYTYATMDDSIISSGKFDFPIDDIPDLVDGLLFSVAASASISAGNQGFISNPAVFSGYLFWPFYNPANTPDSDLFLNVNGSELLQYLLDNKIEH